MVATAPRGCMKHQEWVHPTDPGSLGKRGSGPQGGRTLPDSVPPGPTMKKTAGLVFAAGGGGKDFTNKNQKTGRLLLPKKSEDPEGETRGWETPFSLANADSWERA